MDRILKRKSLVVTRRVYNELAEYGEERNWRVRCSHLHANSGLIDQRSDSRAPMDSGRYRSPLTDMG